MTELEEPPVTVPDPPQAFRHGHRCERLAGETWCRCAARRTNLLAEPRRVPVYGLPRVSSGPLGSLLVPGPVLITLLLHADGSVTWE